MKTLVCRCEDVTLHELEACMENAQTSANALKFFKWGFEQGDQLALGLDYVPLPENAVKAIETSWKNIQGSGM
jgi:hypothetical protein